MGRLDVALLALVSVLSAEAAVAAGGDLDPTFGIGGKVWTDAVPDAEAADVALDAGGNVVLLGSSAIPGTGSALRDVFLVRYDPDGALDQTFGTGGVTAPMTLVPGSRPTQLGTQSTGEIVVSFNLDAVVARFAANGSLDASFGTSGLAAIDASFSGVSGPLAVQSDDKIVVVARDDATTEMIVARFDPDGSLDASFGTGGVVATGVPSAVGFGLELDLDLAVQPDGKILAMVSNSEPQADPGDVTFVRLETTGAFDASFGTSGILVVSTGLSDATRFARQADGKLVIGGVGGQVSLERYLETGVIDATFGSAGQVGGIPIDVVDVILQPDGQMLVVGFADAVRLASDGSLDATFGACGGVGALTGLAGTDAFYHAATRLADGRFVVAGATRAIGGQTTMVGAARFGSATAIPTCQSSLPGRAKISFKGSSFDRMRWLWKSADEVLQADFGEPENGTDLILCVVDGSGGFVQAATFPGGTACPTKPCWKATTSAVKYRGRDFDDTFEFVRQSPRLRVKPGAAGRAKLLYRDNGLVLPLNPFLWPVPFTTRLVTGTGSACWEATFSAVTKTGSPANLTATSD